MYDSLNKLLCTETVPLEQHQFVHISGRAEGKGVANPSFLVHHFLNAFLKHGYKVCLVSCSQTLSQYKIIEGKLGVNLDQAAKQGNFTFVSVLNLCIEQGNLGLAPCHNNSTHVVEEKFFDNICSFITAEVTSKVAIPCQPNSPMLFIFDELTTLLDLGVQSSHVLNMICQVQALYSACSPRFLTRCDKFDLFSSGMEACALSAQLAHWSDLQFHVECLSTGVSKDVHGQLKICHRMASRLGDKHDTYHYKVADRDLKLFAVGESPAVL